MDNKTTELCSDEAWITHIIITGKWVVLRSCTNATRFKCSWHHKQCNWLIKYIITELLHHQLAPSATTSETYN